MGKDTMVRPFEKDVWKKKCDTVFSILSPTEPHARRSGVPGWVAVVTGGSFLP
jgi:hypothetical protein